MFLTSSRLELHPLTTFELRLLKKDRKEMELYKGWQVSNQIIDDYFREQIVPVMDWWISQTEQHPAHYQWFTAWEIVLQKPKIAIGGIGFMGLPIDGETMVGYHIDQTFQSCGYASEALQTLLDWAFQNPDLKSVLAHTNLDNLASQKVLLKNDFQAQGTTYDEGVQVYQWRLKR